MNSSCSVITVTVYQPGDLRLVSAVNCKGHGGWLFRASAPARRRGAMFDQRVYLLIRFLHEHVACLSVSRLSTATGRTGTALLEGESVARPDLIIAHLR